MGKLDGRCLCGAITYSCDAEPLFTAICHCKDCQRQSGTAFSIVVAVPRDALKMEGDTVKTVTTIGEDHGEENLRRFCGECGSPLTTESPKLPDAYILKAGTLDDTSWLMPQVEVWGKSAQPWVEPTQARPRLDRGPQG